MAFVPRLSDPGTTNPYWIQTGSGGLNPCIYASGNSVLPNCVSGDTKVITQLGVFPIKDCVGLNLKVLSNDFKWHDATFNYFGKQQLYSVTIGKNTYFTTANHRWPVYSDNYKFIKFVTTEHLTKFDCVLNILTNTLYNNIVVCPTDMFEDVYCAIEPVTHTFTLDGGFVTGNCVGWAFGRFYEILGSMPSLCRGDAGKWYGYTQDGYERGSVPRLGAVACWAKPGDYGHVAIVEQINSDGSIVTSNSGWGSSRRMWTERGTSPKWISWNSYIFQGFIYNPAVDTQSNVLQNFLAEAESHIGEHGDWTWSVSGLGRGGAWCAAFIVAVAKTVGGILGTVIPMTYGASEMARLGVSQGMGTWLPGPHQGGSPVPQAGDLILFQYTNMPLSDTYMSSHIGIVKEVIGNTVITIEGNTGTWDNNTSYVKKKEYNMYSTTINGYYRPNWTSIGGYSTIAGGQLYTMENTREDAILREVGYMQGFTPSINRSNVKLSVINYTSSLGAFFKVMVASGSIPGLSSGSTVSNSGISVDASNLSAVPREIVQYIINKGLPAAAGVGIAANVQAECGFNISSSSIDSNGLRSGGMCQWNGTNFTSMVNYVGSNWATNLTGQLDFLWYDMTARQPNWFKRQLNRYFGINRNLVDVLREVANNESGARRAADIFVRVYENPADHEGQSARRQTFASQLWSQLVPQLTI